MKFTAIDFETANNHADSACSIGIVQVEQGVLTHKQVHLIKPPYTGEQWLFTYIHGLTYSDVAKALTFGELWPQIEHFFKDIDFVVAHNASFDLKVLRACCQRYDILLPHFEHRCTVQVARNKLKIRPANLANVCRELNITLNHHEALSDASACAQIMMHALTLES